MLIIHILGRVLHIGPLFKGETLFKDGTLFEGGTLFFQKKQKWDIIQGGTLFKTETLFK